MDLNDWIVAASAVTGISLATWIVWARRRDDRFLRSRFEQLTNDYVKIANNELEENRAGRLKLRSEIASICADQANRSGKRFDILAEQIAGLGRDIEHVAGSTESRCHALEQDRSALIEAISARINEVAIQCAEMARTSARNSSALTSTFIDTLERSQRDFEDRVAVRLTQAIDGGFLKNLASMSGETRPERTGSGPGEPADAVAQKIGEQHSRLARSRAGEAFGRTRLESLLRSRLPPEQYKLGVKMKDDDPREISAVLWRKPDPDADPSWLLVNVVSVVSENGHQPSDESSTLGRPAPETLIERLRWEARWLQQYGAGLRQSIDGLVIFLPTETIFEESHHVPGLHDELLSGYGVLVAGPVVMTTLLEHF